MKAILILTGAALLAVAGFLSGIAYRAQEAGRDRQASQPKAQRRILYYVDPMHPAYKSSQPGVAPDCGMKLVPMYAGDTRPGQLNISNDKQQLIGVQYRQAELTASASSFRAVGKVALDETRVVHVHSRVEGWIEQVFVDFTGAPVARGQPLLTIYSPEMLSAEQDYLLAPQARAILKNSPLAEAAVNSESLIRASHTRLELLDLNAAQFDAIESSGKAQRAVTLRATAGGFVMTRNAFPGQKVGPDTELYAISDLSRVWIMADVFESDALMFALAKRLLFRSPTRTDGHSLRGSASSSRKSIRSPVPSRSGWKRRIPAFNSNQTCSSTCSFSWRRSAS